MAPWMAFVVFIGHTYQAYDPVRLPAAVTAVSYFKRQEG